MVRRARQRLNETAMRFGGGLRGRKPHVEQGFSGCEPERVLERAGKVRRICKAAVMRRSRQLGTARHTLQRGDELPPFSERAVRDTHLCGEQVREPAW